LVKRYNLNESIGKVLWHSLDKSGNIEEYDMQFGNTIIRGLLPEDIEPQTTKLHEHNTQKRDGR